MIQEVIVNTQNKLGELHIAPMGIRIENDMYLIQPFSPSRTLDNIISTEVAVVNFCDDGRVFAGCITGRTSWPTFPALQVNGQVLSAALAHTEVGLTRVVEDSTRPTLYCKPIVAITHAPFNGFNRAQFSVLEAAILSSRLDMLPIEKIEAEIDYLKIGLEKTAGSKELEAWTWLMKKIAAHKAMVKT
jgi:hypothetical protein